MDFSDETIINYGINSPVGLSFQLFIENRGHHKYIYISDNISCPYHLYCEQ